MGKRGVVPNNFSSGERKKKIGSLSVVLKDSMREDFVYRGGWGESEVRTVETLMKKKLGGNEQTKNRAKKKSKERKKEKKRNSLRKLKKKSNEEVKTPWSGFKRKELLFLG